ncbi:MAG: hypothetical protein ISR85_06670 [Kiritimatiellales bacterium]|nr:hypothetical protein [Kiritimatiellota bacterium]MBL7012593.1 hypothetical protein [Kiritimatiellales bacterium]
MNPKAFKICTSCHASWPTLEEFLSDPEVMLAGYQAHFDDLLGGLFLFSHVHDGCYTTLGIPVGQFVSLSKQPILNKRSEPTQGCPGLCVREGALELCPLKCECNWVREVLQTIKKWPRQAA